MTHHLIDGSHSVIQFIPQMLQKPDNSHRESHKKCKVNRISDQETYEKCNVIQIS